MDAKSEAREKKRAEFSQPRHGKSKTTIILIGVLVVLAGAGA